MAWSLSLLFFCFADAVLYNDSLLISLGSLELDDLMAQAGFAEPATAENVKQYKEKMEAEEAAKKAAKETGKSDVSCEAAKASVDGAVTTETSTSSESIVEEGTIKTAVESSTVAKESAERVTAAEYNPTVAAAAAGDSQVILPNEELEDTYYSTKEATAAATARSSLKEKSQRK